MPENGGLAEAVNRPNLTFAVSPKYLPNETKIHIFITRIPKGVYIIFWAFFKNFAFPTSGRYLQTSALQRPFRLPDSGPGNVGNCILESPVLQISLGERSSGDKGVPSSSCLRHSTESNRCLKYRIIFCLLWHTFLRNKPHRSLELIKQWMSASAVILKAAALFLLLSSRDSRNWETFADIIHFYSFLLLLKVTLFFLI